MFCIRCPKCDYRVPTCESRDGLCLSCWERQRQQLIEEEEEAEEVPAPC